MTGETGADEARREAEYRRAQISAQRRELAQTVGALHDKADVARRVQDKVAGAQAAAADLVRGATRPAQALPRLVKWAAAKAGDQVRGIPEPVRDPIGSVVGSIRSRLRGFRV